MRRPTVFALALMFVFAAPQSAQSNDIPVYVTVRGAGTIRVRIADGPTAPCGSGDRLLFDGEVSAGQSIMLNSSRGVLCVEHTYGALRKVNWTSSSFVRQRCMRSRGCEPFIRVQLSTEKPFWLER